LHLAVRLLCPRQRKALPLGEIFKKNTLIMKKIILILVSIPITLFSFSQFVARAEIKENIEGVCDKKNVYALMGMLKGQIEAVCSVKNKEIETMLNDSVQYIKDKPDYSDKGMVSLIINCKGDVVQCKIDNKTKSPLLDEQVVNVFKTLTSWKPGKLNKDNVDSIKLWSFEIKDGKIKLN
jgi:DNA-binding protein YbaB